MKKSHIPIAASLLASALSTGVAHADGTPPPDAKALVAAPTSSAAAAPGAKVVIPDHTAFSLAAGGQSASGNSRLLAGTVNGKFDFRSGDNGMGASLVGNYGEAAVPPATTLAPTTENLQGRVRYDRYVLDPLSVFLIGTMRHDKFQGLALRTNIDPGVKYLVVDKPASHVWFEAGYDFQYDMRTLAGRQAAPTETSVTTTVPDPDNPGGTITTVTTTTGPLPALLPSTVTDNSVRGFVGWKQAFTPTITFATGLEYLQSFVTIQHSRVNYDALLTANVVGGIAIGAGFTARYDNDPLPGKVKLDTTSTLSIIYSFSDAKPVVPPPPCAPCSAPRPPPPAPAAAPSPAPPPAAAPTPPAPATPAAAPTPPAPVTPAAAPAPTTSPAPPPAAP